MFFLFDRSSVSTIQSLLLHCLLTCNKCDYVTKKKATLEKHVKMKHEDHMCKECNMKVPSFMGLLKHIAEEHGKEEVNEDEDMV